MELWKAIPGHEGFYDVSTLGNVRSVSRSVDCYKGTGKRWVTGRILKRAFDTDGYPVVSISTGAKQRTRKVHQLVLLTFRGPVPEGQESRHLNDVKEDCTLINLEYGTPVQNWEDRVRNGNGINGELNPNWKGGISL